MICYYNCHPYRTELFNCLGEILVSSGNQRQTLSNAMDSQWSPALTRILWTLSPGDPTGLYDEESLQKLKLSQPIVISAQVSS